MTLRPSICSAEVAISSILPVVCRTGFEKQPHKQAGKREKVIANDSCYIGAIYDTSLVVGFTLIEPANQLLVD